MSKENLAREAISGSAGAIAMIATVGILNLPLLAGALAGASFYAAARLLIPRKPEAVELLGDSDADRIREAWERVAALEKDLANPKVDESVREKGREIAQMAKGILRQAEESEKKIRAASSFFGHYLEASARIVDKYADLAEACPKGQKRELAEKALTGLDLVEKAFESQISRMMENDEFDLDNEIGLLEKTLKMEGVEKWDKS